MFPNVTRTIATYRDKSLRLEAGTDGTKRFTKLSLGNDFETNGAKHGFLRNLEHVRALAKHQTSLTSLHERASIAPRTGVHE